MPKENTEYQNGILMNLLNGFYERTCLESKNESLRALFQDLRKEFKALQEENKKIKEKLTATKLTTSGALLNGLAIREILKLEKNLLEAKK